MDSSRTLVYIHLLGVGGVTSEVATERSSIDKEITRHDTGILPLSKNIEAHGLFGAISTHESRHCTGLDIHLVEESKSSTRDWDSVIDTFPGESLVVSEGSLLLLNGELLGFNALGNPLLPMESCVEFGGLLGLFSEDGEPSATKRRSLETCHLLGTLTKKE